MKASELRIGNLVYHIDKIIEIESLHPKDDDVNNEIPFHAIFGIPLTEEWLLRFGFKRIFENSKLFLNITNDIYIYWYNEKLNGCVRNHYIDSDNQLSELDFEINIIYVHQLQNLYFALTNTELT